MTGAAAASEAASGPRPGLFHWGELEAQARMGHERIGDWAQHAIRPAMPDQHRRFFESQPFLVAAVRDGAGLPWATILAGDDGFVSSPDTTSLDLATGPVSGDALEAAFGPDAEVGLLGIEFATRRRNRVNGRVVAGWSASIHFQVSQSFGNCPQHIPERLLSRVAPMPGAPRRGQHLDVVDTRLIQTATSFFIASGYAGDGEAAGLDVSHRGGTKGFVMVEGDRWIVFPDYGGNRFMNTVGNLLTDPRVGLLFVDFATGGMLQMSGRADILWDGPELLAHPGAERLIRIDVDAVVALPGALPLRWKDAADSALAFKVAARVQETADIVSFHLAPSDGAVLPSFKPGQHLPLLLDIPGAGRVERTYSISGRGEAGGYRITVKRAPHGVASTWLHDHVHEGALLAARPPAGAFGPPGGGRPLLLISAGAGATPMAAILEDLATTGATRPVWRLHGSRDAANDLFAEETRVHGASLRAFTSRTFYSQTTPARPDAIAGRITPEAIRALTGDVDADIVLSGPTAFVADMEAGLARVGFDPKRIRSESFG